jgi:ribonuclease HI
MKPIRSCEVFIDGASLGNPGPAGIGVVFLDGNAKPFRQLSKYLGETTNNVAEYLALVYALQEAHQIRCQQISVKTDSELLARQLTGRYKVRNTPSYYNNLTLMIYNNTSENWNFLPTALTADENGTIEIFTIIVPTSRYFAIAKKTGEDSYGQVYLEPIKYFELQNLPEAANETITFKYVIIQDSMYSGGTASPTPELSPTQQPSCSSANPGSCYTQSDCTGFGFNWCADSTGAIFSCQSQAC